MQYVGDKWGDGRAQCPLNLLALYCQIVGRQLVAKAPRVLLSTRRPEFRAIVDAMQEWVNPEIERTCLAKTLQEIVLDALFCLGIAKVALAGPEESALYSWALKSGEPFVARVSLDDFSFDTHARCFEEADYIGHRYDVPYDVVMQDKRYDKKAKRGLQPSRDERYNEQGDEKVSTLGKGFYSSVRAEEHVALWELWSPRHRKILTFSDDQVRGGADAEDGPLYEQDWLGPDSGPYHFLILQLVPDNAMPKAPIQDLVGQARFVNNLYLKLMDQAERQKENLLVAGSHEDAKRITEARDGEAIGLNGPDSSVVREYGGPSQKNFGMFTAGKDLFSYTAGNLEMLGGLSPQSKTATQDELLAKGASGQIGDMQQATAGFTSEVIRSMMWFHHHNPYKTMESSHPVPGLPGVSIPRRLDPMQRLQVPFEELDVRTDPYSMQFRSPGERVQMLQQIFQTVLLPILPLIQQQGIGIDMHVFLEKLGAYLDLPELAEMLTLQPPPQAQEGQGQEPPSMPSNTTRQYVRNNRSEATPQQNRSLIAGLMGTNLGGQQNGQQNGNAA